MSEKTDCPTLDGRIVRSRKKRIFDTFRKPTEEQMRWALEPCPDPRWGGRHLEVMFHHRGVPYCGCPPCDAAWPGFQNPYNVRHDLLATVKDHDGV